MPKSDEALALQRTVEDKPETPPSATRRAVMPKSGEALALQRTVEDNPETPPSATRRAVMPKSDEALALQRTVEDNPAGRRRLCSTSMSFLRFLRSSCLT